MNVTLGGIPTSDAVFSSLIFHSDELSEDPVADNDASHWTTTIVGSLIFEDGFENGDTAAWSATAPTP